MSGNNMKNLTIIELMTAINKRYMNTPALQIKEGGKMRCLSYIDLGIKTADASYNLMKLGIERGDRVAILSESRPEWAIAFFASVSCAAITVPIDIKLSDAEIEFILNNSETKCVFASAKFLERIHNLKPKLNHLKNIICLDDEAGGRALLLKDFKSPKKEVKYRDIELHDRALIIYTSGTTGVAKGVELTYQNLLFEVTSLHEFIQLESNDNFLSILPLNHMLEITSDFLSPLYKGATITYCDSIKPTTIISLMNETKTTVMICVPLILKMFYNGIMKKIDGMPLFKKMFVKFMLEISNYLLKFDIRIGKSFFSEVHEQFGGNIRCFISGGAPLDPVVEKCFNAMGFHILQGYGLTETSPVVTVNSFKERKYGSVGKPMPGVEVQIKKSASNAKEGEIIVRGPNVMRGYYKNQEKTDEVLRGGWFYTGDIGYLDKDGFLFISGRLKNMIVLGAGKKVFPEEIEEVMSKSPYIKEICVIGRTADKGIRKGSEEVFAVIVPNIDYFDKEHKEDKEFIKKTITSEIDRLSENLAEYKKIPQFEIFEAELPKTSTRKIKRKAVLEMMQGK